MSYYSFYFEPVFYFDVVPCFNLSLFSSFWASVMVIALSILLFFSLNSFSTFCSEGFLSHEGTVDFFYPSFSPTLSLVLFFMSQTIKGTSKEYVFPVPVGL
jgi:hypothetical protein